MGAAALALRGLSPRAEDTAAAYAASLLAELGVRPGRAVQAPVEHPALSWADAGLMALTGERDGEPQMCPAPLAACAEGALAALAALAPPGAFADLQGAQLLGERAAIAGLVRAGAASPGGACRLLETADGAIALNLAREDDWALLPAWCEAELAFHWDDVARVARTRPTAEWVARGRLLGLAVAADEMPAPASDWFHVALRDPQSGAAKGIGPADAGPPAGSPLVVDLSSLWAGPLCSHLLQRLGARVIKVESLARPDGARRGAPAFFDLLNAGKASVALDFGSAQGRAQLRALLQRADIVIEGSRPRALRQLGIEAEALVRERPGLTWLSLCGYGRDSVQETWVAYGDDAGVAAGLSAVMRAATGRRLIVGDAIADPLTGLHAALAAWCCHRAGGGLLAVALRDVVAHCLAFDTPREPAALRERHAQWCAVLRSSGRPVRRPRLRSARVLARPLGADNVEMLAPARSST